MDTHAEHLSKHDQASGHPSPRARTVLAIGIGLYLLVLGGLGGTLAERIRFDLRREPVLARYDALLRARNAGLMAIELDSAQRSGPARGDLAPVPSGTRAAAGGN
ncbi:MAG TPA: hypothetical protein VEL75_23255 [Candidatus Methylomirabilis sp.]|nr:hypothetical protein [Candidatus Methylomirabilis sp.]